REAARHLPFGDLPDVVGCQREAAPHASRRARPAAVELRPGERSEQLPRRTRRAGELPRPFDERLVAALPHVDDNAGRLALDLRVARFVTGDQCVDRLPIRRPDDPHHSTILFRGYSTIPCAPAALSCGMSSRTVRSSMMVLTATQPSSLSGETVGRCSAGSSPRTWSR